MTRSRFARRLIEDRGASMVEFTLVFVFLVLPLTLFGMELILGTFTRQQATAAARDGARAAIVSYGMVDKNTPPSADYTRARNAVLARVPFTPTSIVIRCTEPDLAGTSGDPATKPCADAVPSQDRVEVTVTMRPIEVMGAFGRFVDPLRPNTDIVSKASQVVLTKE